MRVLFVFPDLSATVTDYTGVPHYGIATLSAVLRRDGHTTRLYHLTREPTEEEFRRRIEEERPDLVAFSAITHYARRLARWTKWAREASGAPVIVGGVHATFAADEVSALPHVDYTCVGEGEEALSELCGALSRGEDTSGIASLRVRRGDRVIVNPLRPIVDDLDGLPEPDLSLFDMKNLYPTRQGMFSFLMSRGCAFRCTYCDASSLMKLAPRRGKFWRFMTPERAASRLATLLARHAPDAKYVSFGDAIFFPNKGWLREFVPHYRDKVGLPLACNLRADFVDEETVELLRALKTRIVRMGVESGNQWLTREVLKRHLDVADLRRAYRLLREAGIERWSYNIVGLPSETLPMALETVRLNAEIVPDDVLPFLFHPYPGTELHRLCAEKGYLTDREVDHYQVGVTIRQPQFPERDVLFVHRFFLPLVSLYRLAGRLPGPLAGAAARALDRTLASRWFPRGILVRGVEALRRFRHRLGEALVNRSPRLYRLLGGRAPLTNREMARADA